MAENQAARRLFLAPPQTHKVTLRQVLSLQASVSSSVTCAESRTSQGCYTGSECKVKNTDHRLPPL